MKTKLLTIAMTAALMFTAMTKVQAQNFEGPCLPQMHGYAGHQSALCGSILTQTIALSAGYNWFSTYIGGDPYDLLDMLKESLGDNALTIEGDEGGMTEYLGDGFWMGGLDDYGLTNGQMYIIEVENDCSVELTGMPVDPSEVEITINPGWNWIGYPVSEEMDIVDALAGYDVEDGDMIESNFGGLAEYLGDGFWMGFDTLEPGQGYLYYSASDEVKTMVFQTGGTKARVKAVSPNKTKKPRLGLDDKQ